MSPKNIDKSHKQLSKGNKICKIEGLRDSTVVFASLQVYLNLALP